jgi:hypothetical protein
LDVIDRQRFGDSNDAVWPKNRYNRTTDGQANRIDAPK